MQNGICRHRKHLRMLHSAWEELGPVSDRATTGRGQETGPNARKLAMDLIGTWQLKEWISTLDGVDHGHPFGRDAQGCITYTADGFMSAILMRPDRPAFTHANFASGSEAEKLAAASGYISYAGVFRIEGKRVIHEVGFSLLPNWIGTELVREISWTTDIPAQLILTALPETTRSGKVVVNRLRWARQ